MNKIINKYNNIKFKNKYKKNFISVIIPVYKNLGGLKETLNTLKNQSLNKINYEIIIVNDGGEQSITNICKKYCLYAIEILPNMGSYFARNRGIEIAKGEYIVFLDADIKVNTNWLENGFKELKKGADYISGQIKIDQNKIKTLTQFYESYTAFPVKKYLYNNHFGPTANLFIKRKIINKIGGFDERLKSGGDNEFGNRVYYYTNFKQKYSKNITVLHPPRNYREKIRKIKRTTRGTRYLNLIYPNRFLYELKITDFLPIKSKKIGGIKFNKQFLIKYLLGYWFKLIKSYYKVKFILTIKKNDNINKCEKIIYINFNNEKK